MSAFHCERRSGRDAEGAARIAPQCWRAGVNCSGQPHCLSFVTKIATKIAESSSSSSCSPSTMSRQHQTNGTATSNGTSGHTELMNGDATEHNKLFQKLNALRLSPTSLTVTRTPRTAFGGDSSSEPESRVISPSPRQDEKRRAEVNRETVVDVAGHYRHILEDIGEDPTRQGLLKTPERAAKALLYFTKGYDEKITGGRCSNAPDLVLSVKGHKVVYLSP